MTERPIRVGIVGAGRILPAHLRGYRLLREVGFDDFRITGIVSRRRQDAESFVRRGQGPPPRAPVSTNPADPLSAPHLYVSDFQPDVDAQAYASLDDMLADDAVDALDIGATVAVHHTATLQALRAGKHCLVQKPLAVSVRAGVAMVEEARRRSLCLGVFENVRYAVSTRAARWLIDAGYLGTPQMACRFDLGGGAWGPDRIVAETPWRHQKLLAGGGASLDIGVHTFHWLRYLLGDPLTVSAATRIFEPRRVQRDTNGQVVAEVACDVDDAFFAVATMPGNAVAQMSFAWAGHAAPTSLGGPLIYGGAGRLHADELRRDDGSSCSADALFHNELSPADAKRFFPYGLADSFALVELDFLRAIRAGHDPETSGQEGLLDLACAMAINESSALGRAVNLDEVLTGQVNAYQADIDRHYGL